MGWVKKAFWGDVWARRIRWRGRWWEYLGKEYSWQREQHMQRPDWHFWGSARSRQCGQVIVSTWQVEEGEAGPITRGQIMCDSKHTGRTFNFVLSDGKSLIQGKWVKYFFFTPFYFACISVYTKAMFTERNKCRGLN